jgi:hypothetical protein
VPREMPRQVSPATRSDTKIAEVERRSILPKSQFEMFDRTGLVDSCPDFLTRKATLRNFCNSPWQLFVALSSDCPGAPTSDHCGLEGAI